jgi:hypothetical protein
MWTAAHIPQNLSVFIAAIFLSNSVNEFTTIYAVPGKPVVSFGLILSCVSSLIAAGFWTALAAKKESIEKAVASGAFSLKEREQLGERMWTDVWLRILFYLTGAVVLSLLGLIALMIPEG